MAFRDDVRGRAKAMGRTVVLAEGQDARVALAAKRIGELEMASTIVLTSDHLPRQDDVAGLLRARRPDRVTSDSQAATLASDPVVLATGLVALGEADVAVAGATCPTAHVIRSALWLVGAAEGIRTVSSAFYMSLDGWAEAGRAQSGVLTFTDAGVVPDPTADQLVEIAQAAARDRRRIVGDAPIVAFLSYSTRGSADGPRVDKVRRAAALFRECEPDIRSDGELQADAALVPEVAQRKAADSPTGGQANVLVFPDLDSGNIAYKLVQRLAGCEAAGPIIQGLAKPVADLSRGASAEDIIDVAAVAVLQSARTSTTGEEA